MPKDIKVTISVEDMKPEDGSMPYKRIVEKEFVTLEEMANELIEIGNNILNPKEGE